MDSNAVTMLSTERVPLKAFPLCSADLLAALTASEHALRHWGKQVSNGVSVWGTLGCIGASRGHGVNLEDIKE